MVAEAKEVGKNRTRESYGRYLEDFKVGDVYEHRPVRTITESDNTWFTLLTMNQHPVHFDKAYAAKGEFKKPLVNSALTLSIVAGMSVSDVSQKAIANLGWDKIRLTAPVFVGDTIYAESEVLESGVVVVESRWRWRRQRSLGFDRDCIDNCIACVACIFVPSNVTNISQQWLLV